MLKMINFQSSNSAVLALLAGLIAAILTAPHAYSKKINGITIETSVQKYFGDADFAGARLSPDGKYLAVMPQEDGLNQLVILDRKTLKPIYKVVPEEDHQVQAVNWLNNERLSLSVAKSVGTWTGENPRILTYYINYDGSHKRTFFRKENATYDMISKFSDDDEHIIANRYAWNELRAGRELPTKPKPYKVNIYTGKTKFLGHNFIQNGTYMAGKDGQIVFASEAVWEDRADLLQVFYAHRYLKKEDKWEKLDIKARTGIVPIGSIGEDKENPTGFYFVSELATDQKIYKKDPKTGKLNEIKTPSLSNMYAYDLKTKKITLEFTTGFYDITEGNAVEDYDGSIIGFRYYDKEPKWYFFKPDAFNAQLIAQLRQAFPGKYINLVTAKDKSVALVTTSSDKDPGTFYEFDIKSSKVKYLFTRYTDMKESENHPMIPVEFKARDGLVLRGFLTHPAGKPKGNPLIINPHGGPFGPNDQWRYNDEAQFFADNGISTLQINYRGSGNRGTEFTRMGYLQYGQAMQDDLTDGTLWAIKEGYTSKDNVCIYGASYGGYAALMGVVKEPDLYQCTVGYVGVYDLDSNNYISDYIGDRESQYFIKRTRTSGDEMTKKYSPAFHVDKIKADVFIVHGKDDQRVPFGHAELIAEKFKEIKKPYEWLVKDGEGHGFRKTENRQELYQLMITYFRKHLDVKKKADKS